MAQGIFRLRQGNDPLALGIASLGVENGIEKQPVELRFRRKRVETPFGYKRPALSVMPRR
jgi:hypothetical protein